MFCPSLILFVTARWRSLLKAVDYHYKHSGVKALINNFAADEIIAVKRVQTAPRGYTLEGNLVYLCAALDVFSQHHQET